MRALNLKGIKNFVEAQMTDDILVMRDIEGMSDDVWDEELGMFVGTDPNPYAVFDDKGFISSRGWQPEEELAAGTRTTVTRYTLLIPTEAPELVQDDVVTVKTSMRYPFLIGQRFFIRAMSYSSFAVAQRAFIELWDPRRPR
jgi:hypothetical protein